MNVIIKEIAKKIVGLIPTKIWLSYRFKQRTGYKMDWKNPVTFNQKLQWLKVYDRKTEYTQMVDKYAVKKYVADKIGEEYIIPTLGVWDSFDEIDFETLPDQFVLKCTHDSGSVVIVRDKSKFDKEKAQKKIKRALGRNPYNVNREWPYKNVPRRIIAEKYMVDESGRELKDYKVMCFDGIPKLIQIHCGRFETHTQDFYDIQWCKQDIEQGSLQSNILMEKPIFLEQMLELSEYLSRNIPHLRVDWYYVEGQLYFGEVTFFDGAGFEMFKPEKWDYKLGEWIDLSKIGKKGKV